MPKYRLSFEVEVLEDIEAPHPLAAIEAVSKDIRVTSRKYQLTEPYITYAECEA